MRRRILGLVAVGLILSGSPFISAAQWLYSRRILRSIDARPVLSTAVALILSWTSIRVGLLFVGLGEVFERWSQR